jgi:hypothetical protein
MNKPISGSVGITLFMHKKLNKYVLLFADIHAGVTYCKTDHHKIEDWLDNKTELLNDVLLEEVDRSILSKLQELWPSSSHIQGLKKLSIKNNKVKPIDIRPLLLPFSWEICNTNNNMGNMLLKNYLKILDDFFMLKNISVVNNYIKSELNKLNKDKEKFKVSILFHLKEINEQYNEFKITYEYLMDKTLNYIYNLNTEILEKINNITSLIMEWYIILLIHNSNNNTIIHVGLAHSNRILDLLLKVYQFNIIKQYGINKLKDAPENLASACVNTDSDINKLF